ncbi:hypothetical protein AB0910_26870 [Streptomyces sp. NPDC047002]|uniref:hypothetical protein n=1 Tax=Streptomyces sp. NPDC047002 TaxID=3155475 RepID=UPI003452A45D
MAWSGIVKARLLLGAAAVRSAAPRLGSQSSSNWGGYIVRHRALRDVPDASLVKTLLVQDTALAPTGANLLAEPGPLSSGAADAFHITWRNYGETRAP